MSNQKGFSLVLILLGVVILIGLTGGIYYIRGGSGQNVKVEDIPNDFEVQYSWGACRAEKGRNDLKINKGGYAELDLSRGFFKENKKYSFNQQEIAEIYSVSLKNNFFSLDPKYRDTNIFDGSCSTLTFNTDGKSHQVAMINQSPNEIIRITEKMLEILKSKDNNYDQINKKPLCDKAKASCASEKEYQGASCDFWNKSCEGI